MKNDTTTQQPDREELIRLADEKLQRIPEPEQIRILERLIGVIDGVIMKRTAGETA